MGRDGGFRESLKELVFGKDEPVYRSSYVSSYDQHLPAESRTHYKSGYNGSELRGDPYTLPYVTTTYEGTVPVHEFMVPMCCDKCREKVQEELSEVEGVQFVSCDQYNHRVRVTGDVDIERAIKKAERAVKKKCELLRSSDTSLLRNGRSEIVEPRYETSRYVSSGLVRSNSHGRKMDRLSSFSKPQYENYREDYEPRRDGYNRSEYSTSSSFRRMPSFNRHRHHDAEYITDARYVDPVRDDRRDYYGNVRRMPSFNRHRHHDAEYISVDDIGRSEYAPRTFYDDSVPNYSTRYDERPVYRSQVSFSKLPVTNPYYVKHIDSY